MPDCLIETGEVREHCESYSAPGEGENCWPENVKKRYSPIVAVDSPTLDFANYALENNAQTGRVFAMGYGLEEKGSGSSSTLHQTYKPRYMPTTIHETGPHESVGIWGYFFGPTEIEYEIPTKGDNVDGAYAISSKASETPFSPGRRGVCSGDSGGPLTVYKGNRKVVSGVLSHTRASGEATANYCGDPDAWDMYTRVSAFHGWIESTTPSFGGSC